MSQIISVRKQICMVCIKETQYDDHTIFKAETAEQTVESRDTPIYIQPPTILPECLSQFNSRIYYFFFWGDRGTHSAALRNHS